MEITVRTLGKYNNINDIKQVVVANHTGRPVYISEIADVLDSWEDEDTFASANGVPCVMTFVRKQSKTNTVDVTDNVNAKMEELKHSNLPPDIIVDKVRDQSNYIRDNIADVWNAILFGGFLALLITYLFLRNFRATIIGGLCIPTSIIATFFMMKVMGFTLNNMSLMALSLAVGILIDDAIVVIENIFRHIEMGQTPFVAAKEATEELTLAILATSLSLMAVFVPIGNMGETIGQFFKQFGMTIVFATLMSLVVSFTLTPMLASRFYKNGVEEPKGKLWSRLDDFEAQTIAKYDLLLRKCIEKPKKLVLGVLAAFAVAVALVPLGIVGSEYMPRTDESAIQVNIELPTGFNADQTNEALLLFEDYLAKVPEIEHYMTNVTTTQSMGKLVIALKSSDERSKDVWQVAQEIRSFAKQNLGEIKVRVNEIQSSVTGVSGGRNLVRSPVQVELKGSDMNQLVADSAKVEQIFVSSCS